MWAGFVGLDCGTGISVLEAVNVVYITNTHLTSSKLLRQLSFMHDSFLLCLYDSFLLCVIGFNYLSCLRQWRNFSYERMLADVILFLMSSHCI